MRKSYLQIAVDYYKKVDMEALENILSLWLSVEWQNSPYIDILTPVLIQRKLELNEEEY